MERMDTHHQLGAQLEVLSLCLAEPQVAEHVAAPARNPDLSTHAYLPPSRQQCSVAPPRKINIDPVGFPGLLLKRVKDVDRLRKLRHIDHSESPSGTHPD